MDFCNLKAQYKHYQNEIDQAISDVLKSAYFVGGPEVAKLATNLSQYVGSNTTTCANGSDALQIALLALDIGPGDEVITTPFTFIATAEMIALVGAKPVFVDVKEDDFNIDSSKIEAKITSKTKAIMPVSLYGQMADMDEINAIAQKHNLHVIEDAAQSFGATYSGKNGLLKSGNASTLATTSFFPAKPLGCYGDGGAIFCQNEELDKKIKSIANHGQSERYMHQYIGVNSRLDAVQAAVLNVKLKYYDQEIKSRQEIADKYTAALKDKVITPVVAENKTSVWAQYTIRVKNREEIQAKLNTAQIPSAIHYPMPLHLQEAFSYLNGKKGDLPVAEKLSSEVMSLPMSAFVSDDEIEQIVSCF